MTQHSDDLQLPEKDENEDEKEDDDTVSDIDETESYQSTVVFRRIGEVVFPMDILIEFSDGEIVKEIWDGKDGIAVTSEGNVLMTDSDNHLIRQWDHEKKEMSLVAGIGQATFSGDGTVPSESALNFPFGVAVDSSGHVAIADTFNHRIRYIRTS